MLTKDLTFYHILYVDAVMGFVQSLVSLHLPSTGERAGREPHRDWTKVLRRDGSSSGHTGPAGGRVVTVTFWHAASQDRLRAAAAHQTEPRDGDSNLQEAAGRRGSVSTSTIKHILFYCFAGYLYCFYCFPSRIKETPPPPKSKFRFNLS